MAPDLPITAIVTACHRVEAALATLARLLACDPPPDEILVHVDGDEVSCAEAISGKFPGLKILISERNVGPGGGRNKLVTAARHEFVASFDDDSYPIDADFFRRAASLLDQHPDAAVIGCAVVERGRKAPEARRTAREAGSFVGCGVVYRRRDFLDAGGYVPLPVAYGMEEEDLAFRLLDRGKVILFSPWLRVFHDSDLSHRRHPSITSGTIANLALLAFLRYPITWWGYGLAQVLNRVAWSVKAGQRRGIGRGLAMIPAHLWRHRHLRQPVAPSAIRAKLRLRRSGPRPFDEISASPAAPSESNPR